MAFPAFLHGSFLRNASRGVVVLWLISFAVCSAVYGQAAPVPRPKSVPKPTPPAVPRVTPPLPATSALDRKEGEARKKAAEAGPDPVLLKLFELAAGQVTSPEEPASEETTDILGGGGGGEGFGMFLGLAKVVEPAASGDLAGAGAVGMAFLLGLPTVPSVGLSVGSGKSYSEFVTKTLEGSGLPAVTPGEGLGWEDFGKKLREDAARAERGFSDFPEREK
jgi:hypothetical protein